MVVLRLSAVSTDRLHPQEIFLVLVSIRGCVEGQQCRQKDNVNEKLQPATLRFAAQCLSCTTSCRTWSIVKEMLLYFYRKLQNIFLHSCMCYVWSTAGFLKSLIAYLWWGKAFFFRIKVNGSITLRRIKYIMCLSFLNVDTFNTVNTILILI